MMEIPSDATRRVDLVGTFNPSQLEELWMAVQQPIEGLTPLLAGALAYSPSSLVSSDEHLSDRGQAFMKLVDDFLCDAMEASYRAAMGVQPADDRRRAFSNLADEARERLAKAVLLARGAMDPNLPDLVSGHDALAWIRELVLEVGELVDQLEALVDLAPAAAGS